ncbi:hypothetical protein CU098_006627, partial [Rhizopus stolonifer]
HGIAVSLFAIVTNSINKLLLFTRSDEAELQGNYIDPIIYPMFYDPQENICFRWLNKQVPDTDTRRPDGYIYKMKRRYINCSVGFVEVKSEKSDSIKRHEDMIHLTAFCKDSLKMQSSKVMIAVQVV